MRASWRLVVAAALALLVLTGAGPAASSPLAQKVARARRQYAAQEYEQVIRLLTPVVQSPLATIGEKADAFEMLGLSCLILGERERARDAFENLLGLDPGHVLRDPSGSPKLKQFFESVKQSFVPGYQPHATVTLEHSVPGKAVAGRTLECRVSVVRGEEMVRQVILHWRRGGLLTYRTIQFPGQGRMLARLILPRDSYGYQLEYFIEARDATGNTIGRVGSPERPLTIQVSGVSRPGRPFYRKWWFWTVVGVVAASAITTSAVVLSVERAPNGNLAPGKWRLD